MPKICLYLFVYGTKFTNFSLHNVGGVVVVDQLGLLFRFLICQFVRETFAIEVESCQKQRRNLDVFYPPKF